MQNRNTLLICDLSNEIETSLTKRLVEKNVFVDLLVCEQSLNFDHSINKLSHHVNLLTYKSICNNNFLLKKSTNLYSKILITNTIPNVNWIISDIVNPEIGNLATTIHIHKVLNDYALQQKIELHQYESFIITTQIVEDILDLVLLFLDSADRRILVNILDAEVNVVDKDMYSEWFVDRILLEEDLIHYPDGYLVKIRDIFKCIFEVIGVELEYCGKGENERAVIVDYDEELLSYFNINRGKIKLGNTIIKIDDIRYNQISTILKSNSKREYEGEVCIKITDVIKRLIKSKICK